MPNTKKYEQLFEQQAKELDSVALMVLKSNLIVETAVDNILGQIFFTQNISRKGHSIFSLKFKLFELSHSEKITTRYGI